VSFYSEFAPHYDSIFPLEEHVYTFLRGLVPRGRPTAGPASRSQSAGRVLDIGCGTGDYCGRFASEGFEATGVDVDPEMVAAAERRYPGATFRVADMREVGRLAQARDPQVAAALGAPFDMVYAIGNVVSHLETSQFPAFLEGVSRVLSDPGVWMFQVVNWDYILTRREHTFPDVVLDGGRMVFTREYPRVATDNVRFVTRLTDAGRTVFEGEVTLHPMRSTEYVDHGSAHGFQLLQHYADFRRTDFDPARESSSVFVFAKRA
jgi:SAM-dependent methyltransferase